jgi:hypothetical protein
VSCEEAKGVTRRLSESKETPDNYIKGIDDTMLGKTKRSESSWRVVEEIRGRSKRKLKGM